MTSGNTVFNMAIFNGGSYFIDDGRPTPDGIGRTLRTLREVAPTWYFNVPLVFQFLLDAMEQDEALNASFFSRLKMVMYAGAGISQPVWDRLSRLAERMVPGGVPIVSGLGSTETGPFALYYTDKKSAPGNIGVPAVGAVLKDALCTLVASRAPRFTTTAAATHEARVFGGLTAAERKLLGQMLAKVRRSSAR